VGAQEISLINKLREWQSALTGSGDFLEEIKKELLGDSIYVFTPKGDVVELPYGSTPIDFAYHIHTDIGDRCMGAKADGAIVPLKEPLKNTQVVEILTTPSAHPHLDWLRYVRTSRARSKIRHWLAQNEPNLIFDRNIVARHKGGAAPTPVLQRLPKEGEPVEPETQIRDPSRVSIRIGQERNIMIRIAQCCTPSTGDAIVGYISRGRGITVHKLDCPSIASIKDFAERSIEVEWETVSPKSTRRFQVTARITTDLFSEIEGALKKFGGHLIEGKLEDERDTLRGFFTVELDNREDFGRVMKSLRTIPSVVNIHGGGGTA